MLLAKSGGGAADKLYVDDVFSTYLYTGNGSTQTITNGIDLAGKGGMVWLKQRNGVGSQMLYDSVRGTGHYLFLNEGPSSFHGTWKLTFTSNGYTDSWGWPTNQDIVSWTFRKAPKFFDVVTYTGNGVNGRQIPHTLGVEPGLISSKSTNVAGDWNTYHRSVTGDLKLNTADAKTASRAIITAANATTFTVNGLANTNGVTYVAYLFASLAGISKVGSYTGNGSSQTINCGFAAGARFILIKRTDSTGDWYVWDSARGIVAANDPHLSLNTTAAEVTTDDSVDPNNSGFIVNQVTATNINVTSASYIFLAVA